MRAILSKVMTGSMVAGAALLVAACGGSEDAAVNNTAMTEMDSNDMMMMDGMTNDMTAVDAGTNAAGNMATDMTMDSNTTAPVNDTTTTTTTTTDADTTNGM